MRATICLLVCFVGARECLADPFRFFPEFAPRYFAPESTKEVRVPEDFARLKISPQDHVEVVAKNTTDLIPLLLHCQKARVELLSIWSIGKLDDQPTPDCLGALVTGEKSPLRFLQVRTFQGLDGWEQLPAEKFPDLETLYVKGGSITRKSGAWFAALPKLNTLMIEPDSLSDGGIYALGSGHLKSLCAFGDDISCNSFRSWANNETLEFLQIQDLNADTADDENVLAGLKNLKHLNASGQLSPCLPSLYQRLPKLESLVAEVDTDGTMKVLSKLPNLRHLSITGRAVTSEGIQVLCDGASLESLIIAGQDVDDSGVRALAKMSRLRSLHLGATKITDASMDALGELSDLECLSLDSCQVTNAGFAKLVSLQKLRWIDIRYSEILPDASETFTKFPSLEEVVVTGPRWQSADNQKLERLMPRLKISVR